MPTLSDLLAALSRHPGLACERLTAGVQEDPPSGEYVGVVTGADDMRQVASTDLARLDVSGTGATFDTSWYNGAYVWVPDLGLQRTVPDDGYTPNASASSATDQSMSSEQVGVLTLSRSVGTVIEAGTAVEIHAPLPPMFDADRKVSLRSWLNRSLATMRMPVRLTLTGVQNAYRYSLAASAPWLRDEGDLIRVSDREYLTDQDPYVLPGTSRLRFDGATPYLILETPIASGYPFYADVYMRRDRWIAVTGTAAATATAGAITAIAVTRGGTYTTAPTVTITGAGTGGTAHAVLTNGTVSGIVVDAGGSGYVTATTSVTLSAGEFAASSVGLVNLDDVSTGHAEDVALLAYYFVCLDLATRPDLGTDAMWALSAKRVAASVAPYLAWGQPEGPQVRASDRGVWGDSPQFLARRGGGRSARWG